MHASPLSSLYATCKKKEGGKKREGGKPNQIKKDDSDRMGIEIARA